MSRTCGGDSSPSAAASACNSNEIMLFGVRVRVDPMRKIVSMNNLSDYEQPPNHMDSTKPADDFAVGYTSADDAAVPRQHQSTRAAGKDRKRGVAWSEEEHKLFLIGLEKVGKGDWKGISRNFVKTRTPTQVASHAQKYFLRKNNLNRRRRRSSLFDITTASSDSSVTATPMEEEEKKSHQDDTAAQIALPPTSLPSPTLQNSNINPFAVAPFPVTMGPILVPVQVHNSLANMTVCQGYNLNNKNNNTSSALLIHPVPVPVFPVNPSSAPTVLNLNQRVASDQSPLSWSLSLASHQNQSTTRHSSFNNGDSIVTVA